MRTICSHAWTIPVVRRPPVETLGLYSSGSWYACVAANRHTVNMVISASVCDAERVNYCMSDCRITLGRHWFLTGQVLMPWASWRSEKLVRHRHVLSSDFAKNLITDRGQPDSFFSDSSESWNICPDRERTVSFPKGNWSQKSFKRNLPPLLTL